MTENGTNIEDTRMTLQGSVAVPAREGLEAIVEREAETRAVVAGWTGRGDDPGFRAAHRAFLDAADALDRAKDELLNRALQDSPATGEELREPGPMNEDERVLALVRAIGEGDHWGGLEGEARAVLSRLHADGYTVVRLAATTLDPGEAE